MAGSQDEVKKGVELVAPKGKCNWRVAMIGKGNFFFNDTATTEIYTLSLHDALPI